MKTPQIELKPTTLNPAFRDQWKDVEQAEKQSKARREQQAKDNPPKEPTEAELRNECACLERAADELIHYAKQSEYSCNRAASRVNYFSTRLKLLRDSVPNVDLVLAKFRAGERVYSMAGVCRTIEHTEAEYDAALKYFDGQKNISVDWARRLKNFHQHNLPRLEQLKAKVREWDTLYSITHNTDRTRGIGRY